MKAERVMIPHVTLTKAEFNGFKPLYRVYPKVSGLSHNEIYAYNNKHSLRSNTKGYGGKTHRTDS
jgi:hypothetical protein